MVKSLYWISSKCVFCDGMQVLLMMANWNETSCITYITRNLIVSLFWADSSTRAV